MKKHTEALFEGIIVITLTGSILSILQMGDL